MLSLPALGRPLKFISLHGFDASLSGLATHYIPSSRLPALIDALSYLRATNHLAVNDILEAHSADLPNDYEYFYHMPAIRNLLDSAFQQSRLDVITATLQRAARNTSDAALPGPMTPVSLASRGPSKSLDEESEQQSGCSWPQDKFAQTTLESMDKLCPSAMQVSPLTSQRTCSGCQ